MNADLFEIASEFVTMLKTINGSAPYTHNVNNRVYLLRQVDSEHDSFPALYVNMTASRNPESNTGAYEQHIFAGIGILGVLPDPDDLDTVPQSLRDLAVDIEAAIGTNSFADSVLTTPADEIMLESTTYHGYQEVLSIPHVQLNYIVPYTSSRTP